MSAARKVVVITQGGRVVGAQIIDPPPAGQPDASARLRAGPGQKLHELALDVPARPMDAAAIDAFHKMLAARLKPAKRKAKRRR